MAIQQQLIQSASLLSAIDAIRNWRAAVLMFGSLLVTAVILVLAGSLGSSVHPLVGFIFFLLGFAALFYGANAVGIMLMDEAQGSKSRPILAALLTSLSTGHRLLLVMLMVGVTFLVGLLLMALLLLICKIPGLGPLLFAFVFPLCVVVSGIAMFSLYAVVMPLAAPSIWSGVGAMQAVSRLAAIARQRLVPVMLSMIVLLFIVFVLAGILGSIMLTGTLITGGMSAAILNFGGINPMAVFQSIGGSGFGGGSGSAYVSAGSFGGSVVWAIAFSLPALVYLRGCCQVYLSNIQGVDVGQMEEQLRSTLDAAKRKAEQIKAKGEAMAAESARRVDATATAAANTFAAGSAAVTRPTMPTPQLQCVGCGTPHIAGDLFCAGCGCKLN